MRIRERVSAIAKLAYRSRFHQRVGNDAGDLGRRRQRGRERFLSGRCVQLSAKRRKDCVPDQENRSNRGVEHSDLEQEGKRTREGSSKERTKRRTTHGEHADFRTVLRDYKAQ